MPNTTGPSTQQTDRLGSLHRTVYCGQISKKHVGQVLTVMGWVDRRRDLGNLIFLDLRDREGIVQVVASPEQCGALEKAKVLRQEYVVSVTGPIVLRDSETINVEIATGEFELQAHDIQILNTSRTPPFSITGSTSVSEETRLRYRYLDLRRDDIRRNLELRHRVVLEIRKLLDKEGFFEIETPLLTRSTPEGARDYLVPSRLHLNNFYALPQSPQLFKQLLMISGFDKYFQVARCFRDEDLRADRQPEFTQVDIELSFAQMETVFQIVETLLKKVFRLAGIKVSEPFPRLTYNDAISRYGTDRPDVRFGLELVDVSSAFTESSFKIFRKILGSGGVIKGLRVPGRADYSRKQLENLRILIQTHSKNFDLSWVKRNSEGLKSSLPKIVTPLELEKISNLAQLEEQDIFLMVGGPEKEVHAILAPFRLQLGKQEKLILSDSYEFLWVYQFPLLEWDERENRYSSCHHPFTAPIDEDEVLLESAPGKVQSKAYDVVLNGIEIGGGSIRIHQVELQQRVFHALGISPKEANAKFGFFLEAMRYGAPPHGGIALGLDRIIMLLAGQQSIRDVIAFPKTARALDLMCGAPSPVSEEQLKDLHLGVNE